MQIEMNSKYELYYGISDITVLECLIDALSSVCVFCKPYAVVRMKHTDQSLSRNH